MKQGIAALTTILAGLALAPGHAAPGQAPIEKVEIGRNAELRVNGKPFLPIMLWLQSEARIPDGLAIGANTFAGNGGKESSKAYLDALAKSGLYGVLDFDPAAVGHSHLLGWIHGDEPDLPRKVSDADVTAGQGMRLNPSTPLARLVDGELSSWTALDPLQGAEVTVKLKQPVTVQALGVALTVSGNLPVAKDILFLGDGKEILKAALENKRGEQKLKLDAPATFSALTLRVLSTYPSQQVWGSLGEITAYDAAGKNVLLSPARQVPRSTIEAVAADYRKIKEADAGRPVFMTLTANYMKEFTSYDAAAKERLYPGMARQADVLGFDVYPIFGWNRPDWQYRVADGVSELRALAGPKKPLYAWIETNKGSQWISAAKQRDVTPGDTRAEVWMSLIRGATAIGYFTHRWVPDYKQFAPEGEMVQELKRLDDQITRLAPALLADAAPEKIEMTMSDALACHFKATRLEGNLWLFAQNLDMKRKAGKASFRVPGLRAGAKIEVVDENRSLLAEAGAFSDDFEGLAEHVYRIGP